MSARRRRFSFSSLQVLLTKSLLQILLLRPITAINCTNSLSARATTTATSLTATTTIATKVATTATIDDYLHPPYYNLSHVMHEIINGSGFHILRNVFSQEDMGIARSIVEHVTNHNYVDFNKDHVQSHNSYDGIILKLIGKGKIFEKLAQHPVILEITRSLLGPKSQLSSYASHTVRPGMTGQRPHIDYPYYVNDGFFPAYEKNIQRPLLGLSFMVFLTKFTAQNGGTAFRPGSQKQVSYPHDVEDFYRNMVQLEGEPGDVGVFGASTQHCAMANHDDEARVGINIAMVPVYMKPYHEIRLNEETLSSISKDMRTLLATDHPYPVKH